MDQEAIAYCKKFRFICIPTGVTSVLHKYSVTALALHLGADVLYCDLDAVPLGTGPMHYLQTSDNTDVHLAVSTHNYDCLNAGMWFARSSAVASGFFRVLLE